MNTHLIRLLLASALGLAAGAATAQTVTGADPSLGQLLYSTHCVGCHTEQMHWRDNRVVTDWGTLVAQVRRWQDRASLQWSNTEVTEVARHLNDTIYHYPQLGDRISLARSPARQ